MSDTWTFLTEGNRVIYVPDEFNEEGTVKFVNSWDEIEVLWDDGTRGTYNEYDLFLIGGM